MLLSHVYSTILTIYTVANQYATHPLAAAAQNLPSAEKQLAKHREGDFEWVLTINVPKQPSIDKDAADPDVEKSSKSSRAFFGCNLLPIQAQDEESKGSENTSSSTYTLLVSPLEGNTELEAATDPAADKNMDQLRDNVEHMELGTPIKGSRSQPEVSVEEVTPGSAKGSITGDTHIDITPSKPQAKHAARIEDSVEALDMLEDQLEAFNVAAHMRRMVSPDIHERSTQPPAQPHSAQSRPSQRSTPQSSRASPRTSASTLRMRSTESRGSPSARRSVSMIFLDSPKLKEEDKALLQAPPKKAATKGLASLLPPKQPAKSTKAPTVPTFELPGEAVARRLKEKRQARLSMAGAFPAVESPAPSSVRRTKSTKPPTRPTFELPGEAISRRKREERDARLKAQEEEQRRRREFKARPVGYGALPSTAPRETIASRARQNKGPLPENSSYSTNTTNTIPNKRNSLFSSREPLSDSDNQALPRGRHVATDLPVASQLSRATSSSTGSISGKRSSLSQEDAQGQRLRGKEILQRDNLYHLDRGREKREREALTRLAREQAAERSRLLSREWAEKQKRKRMTAGSFRDIVA
jgi:hypothetical protein